MLQFGRHTFAVDQRHCGFTLICRPISCRQKDMKNTHLKLGVFSILGPKRGNWYPQAWGFACALVLLRASLRTQRGHDRSSFGPKPIFRHFGEIPGPWAAGGAAAAPSPHGAAQLPCCPAGWTNSSHPGTEFSEGSKRPLRPPLISLRVQPHKDPLSLALLLGEKGGNFETPISAVGLPITFEDYCE